MICKCERCKKKLECRFYGTPSDHSRNKAQNGEWLCDPCAEARPGELDDAIADLARMLEGSP